MGPSSLVLQLSPGVYAQRERALRFIGCNTGRVRLLFSGWDIRWTYGRHVLRAWINRYRFSSVFAAYFSRPLALRIASVHRIEPTDASQWHLMVRQ